MKKYLYSYFVNPEDMPQVCRFINRGDIMGGWEIEIVKEAGLHILLVLSRDHSYPYVENELKDIIRNNTYNYSEEVFRK
jgi:hypothetical protein